MLLLLGKEAINVEMLIATFFAILEQEVKGQHAAGIARNVPVMTEFGYCLELAQHGKGSAATHVRTITLSFFTSIKKNNPPKKNKPTKQQNNTQHILVLLWHQITQ